MKSFLCPMLLSQCVVFPYTSDPWTQSDWEKDIWITHIPPVFVIGSNSDTRILDRCSPSCTAMTMKVSKEIWYDISSNQKNLLSSMKVSTARDITYKLCVYDLQTSFNRRRVSWVAAVCGSYGPSCLNISSLLRTHGPVKDCYWSDHPPSLSDHCTGIQLATTLMYSLDSNRLPSLSATQRLEHR